MRPPGPPADVDWLVTRAVVTSDDERRVITDGAVAVTGGRIVAVGPRADVSSRYQGRPLGGTHAVVMPGMVDCHNHAAQALVRSLIAAELPMIQRLYLPAEDVMTDDQVRTSATLVALQLLRSGVTTFAETTATPAHEDLIIETVERVGIRCSMARGAGDQQAHHAAIYSQVTDRSWATPRPGEAAADLARTAAFLDRHDPSGSGLVKGGVLASHITGFSPAYFRDAAELARERAASLQVHVARDREEVEFSLAVYGRRPIEQLAEWGVIGPELLAIHAILVTDREVELLAAGGAAVAHQPVECMNILNGVPRVQRLRSRGVTVGLGCDNAINDGFEVMRAAWLLHTALAAIPGYEPDHLPAEDIFAMATSEAARALRWGHEIGSLTPGRAADLVVLDGDAPHMAPTQHPVVDLVRYATRADVQHVMVAGRLLVKDRRSTTVDEAAVLADARKAAPDIAAAVTPRRYQPLAPSVTLT